MWPFCNSMAGLCDQNGKLRTRSTIYALTVTADGQASPESGTA
jgi:hypothetical protein